MKVDFSGTAIDVGELVRNERNVYFRYDEDFLQGNLNLSPFYLKRTTEIQRPNTPVFDGLFGVFADSLPDGWGRLLLDRALTAKGVNLGEISPLDRLAMVGTAGMGALTFHPVKTMEEAIDSSIDLDVVARESRSVLAGGASDLLDELVQLGGSSGGARPKIVVGYDPATDRMIKSMETLPSGFEHWLIKFPAGIDPKDVAKTEMAYYKMALAAGLKMTTCRLFKGKSGQAFFGTKRFDRNGDDRLHLHSAAGLLHYNFRLTNIDYGHVMDAAFRLEKDVRAYEKVLRLAAFNVFAHNRDDHSKNISFLMDETGNWQLAPAYDLTFSQSSHGYHSMTVAGGSKRPGREQLLNLAKNFSIKKPEKIIDEVREAVGNWSEFAKAAAVPPGSLKSINSILNP